MSGWGGIEVPTELDVYVFSGAIGKFTLYEDDGETTAIIQDRHCRTTFKLHYSEQELMFELEPTEGIVALCPNERQYRVHIYGIRLPDVIEVFSRGERITCECLYDDIGEKLVLYDLHMKPIERLTVVVKTVSETLSIHRSRTVEICRDQLRAFRLESETKRAIDSAPDSIVANPEQLHPFVVNMSETQLRAFLETITQAGMEWIDLTDHRELLLLWNNLQNGNLVFSYSVENEAEWEPSLRFQAEEGIIPRSRIIEPLSRWKLAVDYYHLRSIETSGKLTNIGR
ncbi:MAG: DUF5110 domain-containing protein [Candidatus Promineifilaceae bacterium]